MHCRGSWGTPSQSTQTADHTAPVWSGSTLHTLQQAKIEMPLGRHGQDRSNDSAATGSFDPSTFPTSFLLSFVGYQHGVKLVLSGSLSAKFSRGILMRSCHVCPSAWWSPTHAPQSVGGSRGGSSKIRLRVNGEVGLTGCLPEISR